MKDSHKKRIFISVGSTLFMGAVTFIFSFFFTEYPKIKAEVILNKSNILKNKEDCQNLKKDILGELREIKTNQRQIYNILINSNEKNK